MRASSARERPTQAALLTCLTVRAMSTATVWGVRVARTHGGLLGSDEEERAREEEAKIHGIDDAGGISTRRSDFDTPTEIKLEVFDREERESPPAMEKSSQHFEGRQLSSSSDAHRRLNVSTVADERVSRSLLFKPKMFTVFALHKIC